MGTFDHRALLLDSGRRQRAAFLSARLGIKKRMQIQVNTDKNIEGREALVAHVEATLTHALDRFSDRITRLEVHLSDENGDKSGQDDKRCMIEARLEGRQPNAVTCNAGTLHQAIAGATDKLKKTLDSTIERMQAHR